MSGLCPPGGQSGTCTVLANFQKSSPAGYLPRSPAPVPTEDRSGVGGSSDGQDEQSRIVLPQEKGEQHSLSSGLSVAPLLNHRSHGRLLPDCYLTLKPAPKSGQTLTSTGQSSPVPNRTSQSYTYHFRCFQANAWRGEKKDHQCWARGGWAGVAVLSSAVTATVRSRR